MWLSILILTLMLPLTALKVEGARLPNSVEKQFKFTGDKAREIGLLLGFDSGRNEERLYRLGKQDVWALALKENPADPAKVPNKARFNLVHYLPEPEPRLVIEGNWLDTRTGSSPTTPRYIFSSPPLSEDSDDQVWGQLLRHLIVGDNKPPAKGKYWEKVFEKRINDKGEQVFSLEIYHSKFEEEVGRKGYLIIIGSQDGR